MHPVEVGGDLARLVALQRADQVPAELAPQVGELVDLGERLLDVVLAEIALAGGERLAHGNTRTRLAHGQQRHAGRKAVKCPTGRFNSAPDL